VWRWWPERESGGWQECGSKEERIRDRSFITIYVWTVGIYLFLFLTDLQNCEKRLSTSSCLSIRPSVRPHGTTRLPLDGFNEIWYLGFFRKSVEKIRVLLKSDENNRCFAWRRFYIYDNISLNSS
jgi:hypothetical protein